MNNTIKDSRSSALDATWPLKIDAKNRSLSKIDDLDKRILSMLIENSKMRSRDIARQLKVHSNTILQRLKKLELSGILVRYSTVIEYDKIDKKMDVIVFLDVDHLQNWEASLKPILGHQDVVIFSLITGDHDVFLMVRVEDDNSLSVFLKKIRDTKVVKKILTNVVVGHFKHYHDYNPLKYMKHEVL